MDDGVDGALVDEILRKGMEEVSSQDGCLLSMVKVVDCG